MRKPKDPAGEWPLPLYAGYKAPKAGKYEKLMREAMARDAKNRREQAKSAMIKSRPIAKPRAPKVTVWATRCGKTLEMWQVQDIFLSPNPKPVVAAYHGISIKSVTAIQNGKWAVSATRGLTIPQEIQDRRAIENKQILTCQRRAAGVAGRSAVNKTWERHHEIL